MRTSSSVMLMLALGCWEHHVVGVEASTDAAVDFGPPPGTCEPPGPDECDFSRICFRDDSFRRGPGEVTLHLATTGRCAPLSCEVVSVFSGFYGLRLVRADAGGACRDVLVDCVIPRAGGGPWTLEVDSQEVGDLRFGDEDETGEWTCVPFD